MDPSLIELLPGLLDRTGDIITQHGHEGAAAVVSYWVAREEQRGLVATCPLAMADRLYLALVRNVFVGGAHLPQSKALGLGPQVQQ